MDHLTATVPTMWPPDSSGSWADWIAGIGTMIAVVVALAALVIERAIDAKRSKRVDASKFTAWLWHWSPADYQRSIVIMSNATDGVIYDVQVMVGGDERNDTVEPMGRWYYVAVPPGRYFIEIDEPYPLPYAADGVDLVFRDSSGQNWRRSYSGRLRLVDRDYTPAWAKGKSFRAEVPLVWPLERDED